MSRGADFGASALARAAWSRLTAAAELPDRDLDVLPVHAAVAVHVVLSAVSSEGVRCDRRTSRPVTRPSPVTSAQAAGAGVCVRCVAGEAVRCGVRVVVTAVRVGTAVDAGTEVDVGTAVGVCVASWGGPAIDVAVCTAIAVAVCASGPGGVGVASGVGVHGVPSAVFT